MAMTSEEIHDWLNNAGVLPERKDASFADLLKDGITLCRLINRIKPGSVANVSHQKRKLFLSNSVHYSRLARDICRKMLYKISTNSYKHARTWEYRR